MLNHRDAASPGFEAVRLKYAGKVLRLPMRPAFGLSTSIPRSGESLRHFDVDQAPPSTRCNDWPL